MAKLDSERVYPGIEIAIRGTTKSGKITLAALLFETLRNAGLNVAWEDPDHDAKQMQERMAYTKDKGWLPKGKITIRSEQLPRKG